MAQIKNDKMHHILLLVIEKLDHNEFTINKWRNEPVNPKLKTPYATSAYQKFFSYKTNSKELGIALAYRRGLFMLKR